MVGQLVHGQAGGGFGRTILEGFDVCKRFEVIQLGCAHRRARSPARKRSATAGRFSGFPTNNEARSSMVRHRSIAGPNLS